MQTYNYAEEILKDEEYPLPQTNYVKIFSFTTDEGFINNPGETRTFNTDEPYKFATSNIAADKKENAYEIGYKNDGITTEVDKGSGLNKSTSDRNNEMQK